jgi:hypothetical protein
MRGRGRSQDRRERPLSLASHIEDIHDEFLFKECIFRRLNDGKVDVDRLIQVLVRPNRGLTGAVNVRARSHSLLGAMPGPANHIRYRVDPRGIPPIKAARRLGLTLAAFDAKLAELEARGFPRHDPTTGNYDLIAIDAWMDRQSALPNVSGVLTDRPAARNAQEVFGERARRVLNGQG